MLCLLGCAAGCARTGEAPPESADLAVVSAPRGPWLGQSAPGSRPEVFAPGIVSTGLGQRDTAFTADGRELYYSLTGQRSGAIIVMRQDEQGRWSAPRVAPFSGRYFDLEPALSPDGGRLYFASKRPLEGEGPEKDFDLWYVEREGSGWGEANNLVGVNTEADEFYPSVTRDGTVYFTAKGEDSLGDEDIFRSRRTASGYAPRENPGEAVNSPMPEFNAFVAPDESYLIYSTLRRDEVDSGGGDLYVSFREADGSWTPTRNLGPEINSPRLDYAPFVTADGRYLFFASNRIARDPAALDRRDYPRLLEAYQSPGNGLDSLYWVDATVLEGSARDPG